MPEQRFVDFSNITTHMWGCAGSVTWANRASLCGPGAHVCTAAEWESRLVNGWPTHIYWTDTNLGYSGYMGNCAASVSGTPCPAGPFRVCSGVIDDESNVCNWTQCRYENTPDADWFGGCSDSEAGTLCCN